MSEDRKVPKFHNFGAAGGVYATKPNQKVFKVRYTRIRVLVYVRNRLDQHGQAMSKMCWLLPPFAHPIPWDNTIFKIIGYQ